MSNLHDITSPEHLQTLLSADLDRVSVINFWAPWAEPCKTMNAVVKELAKRHPKVLFLQVEAEEQDDIAESFSIESVPTAIVLRGHTLLSRIAGADAAGLTNALMIHTHSTPKPLSKTSLAPAAPPTHSISTPKTDSETPDELEKRMRAIMNQSKVVLFMKGDPDAPRCGFSRSTVALLREQGIDFTHFDILTDESVRQGLKVLNNWPTFPQLIINGEFVGGLDVVKEAVESGELAELLA